jgi:hypothetical protein
MTALKVGSRVLATPQSWLAPVNFNDTLLCQITPQRQTNTKTFRIPLLHPADSVLIPPRNLVVRKRQGTERQNTRRHQTYLQAVLSLSLKLCS